MKLRFMHGTNVVTDLGRGEYGIDTDDFPELSGMSAEQVVKWLYKNREKVGIDYTLFEEEPHSVGMDVLRVVPRKAQLGNQSGLHDSLSEVIRDAVVEWRQIKHEEEYFLLHYDIEEIQRRRSESLEETQARLEAKERERVATGLYEI